MRRRPVVLAALAAAAAATGGAAGAGAQEVRFSGDIATAVQLRLRGCGDAGDCRFLDFRNTNVIGLAVDASASERARGRVRVEVRSSFFARIDTLDQSGDPDAVRPVSLRVDEAAVDLFDVGVDGLDLRIGVQRFPWGTGDGVSPLYRVNPYDLEHATTFDRRLGVAAIAVSFQRGPVRVQAVAVPLFTPALLAVEELDLVADLEGEHLFDPRELAGGADVTVERVETRVRSPKPALRNVQTGVRAAWEGDRGTLALSYFNGRDSLPQADGVLRLTGFGGGEGRVDVGVPLRHPRLQVVGLDGRGELFWRLTGWFEVALLLPVENRVRADLAQLEALERLGLIDEVPAPLPETRTQADEPFVQAVAGVDATLPHGFYLNFQYLRGFLTERQASEQHDYLILAARWETFGGRLALSARGGGERAAAHRFGWLAGAGVDWLHDDLVQIGLGTLFLGGGAGSTLHRFRDLSHVEAHARMWF